VLDRPYWWDSAPRPPVETEVAVSARTDVAVIGGGYTGMSAALALARRGGHVTVLERDTLGAGSSTRNAGFVLPGYQRDPAQMLKQLGAVRARDLWEVSRKAIKFVTELMEREPLACDYRDSGHLILAARPSHYTELGRTRDVLARVFRYETELVPPSRLREELGGNGYAGGLLDPQAGALDPAKLFWGLATLAQRAGAHLVEHADVHKIERKGAGFVLQTSRGALRALHVVVATNAYSGRVLPALRRRVIPLTSYVIATAPLGESVARALVPRDRVMSDPRGLFAYWRFTADTRMVFGGRVTAKPLPWIETARRLVGAMCGLFPRLLGTDIDYHWSGRVGMTADQLPHVGVRDGMHYALGYNGQGVALATYLGQRLAEAVGKPGDVRPFSELPFHPVPFHFARPWLLPLVGPRYRGRDAVR
jgi:glycine/D-amino acid oxidase-like deaminating enzyme